MTGSSTLAPARPRLYVEPVGPEHWELGLSVVAAAQVSTGLPRSVAPQDLASRVLERQRRALGVWLAFARIGWLRCEGYAGCSSVWRDSPGSLRLARRYGRPLPAAGSATHERFGYV